MCVCIVHSRESTAARRTTERSRRAGNAVAATARRRRRRRATSTVARAKRPQLDDYDNGSGGGGRGPDRYIRRCRKFASCATPLAHHHLRHRRRRALQSAAIRNAPYGIPIHCCRTHTPFDGQPPSSPPTPVVKRERFSAPPASPVIPLAGAAVPS